LTKLSIRFPYQINIF